MDVVGVRELRQNASVYLRRVAAGESFTVTDRGRPVAVLGPPPPDSMPLRDRMIAAGELIAADQPGRGAWLAPPLPRTGSSSSASERLRRMRDEERY